MKTAKKPTRATALAAATTEPARVRAKLQAWWGRVLEEIAWVEEELLDDDGVFAGAIDEDQRQRLSVYLNAVWHKMTRPSSLLIAKPAEFDK